MCDDCCACASGCSAAEEDKLKLEAPGGDHGRVLVCRGGLWKRVCDEGERWTKEDAIVTCRQLNYPYPESKQ